MKEHIMTIHRTNSLSDTDLAPRPCIPQDDAMRAEIHQELHARPPARVRLPAVSVFVAVINEGVSVEQELDHLRRLPGQSQMNVAHLRQNFLRIDVDGCSVKWERHTEFTRYSIVRTLAPDADVHTVPGDLLSSLAPDSTWIADIPGRTIAAIEVGLVLAQSGASATSALSDRLAQARDWFGDGPVVASALADGSWALADFRLRPSGLERMLLIAPPSLGEEQAGRLLQHLVEIETYRLMALRGLPVAKGLWPLVSQAEAQLAAITSGLEHQAASEQALLDQLVALAVRVEHAIAEHNYRFSATRAYATLVTERIAGLREQPIPGTQTIGEFMQRRLAPAIATVASVERRLGSLSERISRTSALLRTRVDIAAEVTHQALLARLTRGQSMQLQLQTTVEGLSIAAVSYYVISLLLYLGKGAKAAQWLPVDPEIVVAALVPIVLWGTWITTRSIHARFGAHSPSPNVE